MTASAKAAAKAQASAEIAANVHTAFRELVEAPYANGARPTREELGSTERSEECLEFVPAAHQWGLLTPSLRQVRMEMLSSPAGSHRDRAAQSAGHHRSRAAYTTGYTLWFLCARAAPVAATADPPAQPARALYDAAGEGVPGRRRALPRPAAQHLDRFRRQAPRAATTGGARAAPAQQAAEARRALLAASAPAPAPPRRRSQQQRRAPHALRAADSGAAPGGAGRAAARRRRGLDSAPAPVRAGQGHALFLQAPRSRLAFARRARSAAPRLPRRAADDRVLRVVRRKEGEKLLPPAVEFLPDSTVSGWRNAACAVWSARALQGDAGAGHQPHDGGQAGRV